MHKHKLVSFINWCPTGFKVHGNKSAVAARTHSKCVIKEAKKDAMLIANHCSTGNFFRKRIINRYKSLVDGKKDKMRHLYIENGMEQKEFDDALADLEQLCFDYQDVCDDGDSDDDESY